MSKKWDFKVIFYSYLPSVDDGDAELDDLCESELELLELDTFPDKIDLDKTFPPSSLAAASIPSPGDEQYPASLPRSPGWEAS